jgi:hypothetical protein
MEKRLLACLESATAELIRFYHEYEEPEIHNSHTEKVERIIQNAEYAIKMSRGEV